MRTSQTCALRVRCVCAACCVLCRTGQDVWQGWGYEDPLIYFDKHIQRWRALFHQYRKSGLADHGGKGTWPAPGASIDPNIMSGGYAISNSSDIFGGWTTYHPGFGAGYSKVVNFTARPGTVPQGWPVVAPTQAGPRPPLPYTLGTPSRDGGFRNDSLPTWGGSVVEGDDGRFHLFAAGFVEDCGIGGWETNSEVIHAVGASPGGPFAFSDVALPTWHHNPDIKRCPVSGEFLLYTISCFTGRLDAHNSCTNCHKGHCGPARCKSGRGPTPEGVMTLQRRERPKVGGLAPSLQLLPPPTHTHFCLHLAHEQCLSVGLVEAFIHVEMGGRDVH